MTVLNATAGLSCSGGYANACITAALRSYGAFTGWPGLQTDSGTASAVALTRVIAAAHPIAINATAAHSYADDWYERIHVIPDAINLGNLLTSQTRTVNIWNAWRSKSMTLAALAEIGVDGMAITPPGALPLGFAPLQMRAWSLAISTDGPPQIAAQLTWTFADATEAALLITGQRLTAWFVLPEWSDGVTETLAWLTEVQQAQDGTEWRAPQRSTPRRQWEFSIVQNAQARQSAEAVLFAWRARAWALPVWVDQDHLAAPLAAAATSIPVATAWLDFAVGDVALLRTSDMDYELAEIAAIDANALTLARPTAKAWPVGTGIYPCRVARLVDTATLTRKSSDVMTTRLQFEATEDCDWPATPPPATYLGYPVLEDRIEESNDPTAKYDRVLDDLDNDVGLPAITDRTGHAFVTQSHAWTLFGRDTRAAHRSLLYWLQGRAEALWLPSWSDDLTLALLAGASYITIRTTACGVALYLAGQAGRRHLRIELNDGTIWYRKLIAATDVGDGTEQLQIDSALGRNVHPADVRQISWMMLGRLAGDSVQLLHDTDSMGVARCAVDFVGVPAEEPA